MNPKDSLKKYLVDADFAPLEHEGASRVVEMLVNDPASFSRHEPPAGYEKQLLKALRAKTAAPRKSIRDSFKDWLRLPELSWSLAGTFAALLVVMAVGYQRLERRMDLNTASINQNHDGDLLASTAERGGEKVVNRWIASTGDAAQRLSVADQDFQGLVRELAAQRDPEVVEKAITEVAASMGMKKL